MENNTQMENYLHCVKAANIALQLCERMGAVPVWLENEITFLQALTSPETRIAVPSEDFVRRIFEMEAEPTREMRLPYPVVYLNYAIPIIGRGPSRRKTNLTYHGLILFEVPQAYLDNGGGVLLPFMRDLAPEAFAGLDDEYGRGDIRIMGYNSEGEDPPLLTRLWLHRDSPQDSAEDLPIDDYETFQLRRFVAGFLAG